MKITIDTATDSPEDIRKVVALLSQLNNAKLQNLYRNNQYEQKPQHQNVFAENNQPQQQNYQQPVNNQYQQQFNQQKEEQTPQPGFFNMFATPETNKVEEKEEQQLPPLDYSTY